MFTFYSSFPYFFNISTMYSLRPYCVLTRGLMGYVGISFRFGNVTRREHLLWPKANIIDQR